MTGPLTSHIRGSGYGSSHDWRGETPQDNSKRTHYVCAACGAFFTHHYDDVPDIFTAMERASTGECPAVASEAVEGGAA